MDFSKFIYVAPGKSSSLNNNPVKPQTILTKAAQTKIIPKPKIVESIQLLELYKSPGQKKENLLRLLIVGHNPSNISWERGHYYANPANHMWRLLKKASIVPASYTCENDHDCPMHLGIGFTDLVYGVNETQSNKITNTQLQAAKAGFYQRLVDHVHRVNQDHPRLPLEDCAPHLIAFAGVRQFEALFNGQQSSSPSQPGKKRKLLNTNDDIFIGDTANLAPRRAYGLQEERRPADWPSLLTKTQLFLLPSSSGAAALKNEIREGPYVELGKLLASIPQMIHDDEEEDKEEEGTKRKKEQGEKEGIRAIASANISKGILKEDEEG